MPSASLEPKKAKKQIGRFSGVMTSSAIRSGPVLTIAART